MLASRVAVQQPEVHRGDVVGDLKQCRTCERPFFMERHLVHLIKATVNKSWLLFDAY